MGLYGEIMKTVVILHFVCPKHRTEQNFIMKFTLRLLTDGIREKQIYQKL